MLETSTMNRTVVQTEQQPEWYQSLDDQSRALVDQVVLVLDNNHPELNETARDSVFWRAMKYLGVQL